MNLLALPYSSPEPYCELFDNVEIGYPHRDSKIKLDKNWVILYGGGTDVDPTYYGEKRGRYTHNPHTQRDQDEVRTFCAYQNVVAGHLGICRGAQLLTITNNGRLIQHVDNHVGTHPIDVLMPGSLETARIPANSIHHQMMYPFELPKENFNIVAWTSKGARAKTYLGQNGPWTKPIPKEPDIVWYPKTRSLAIQGHPEFISEMHPYSILARRLIAHFFKESVND